MASLALASAAFVGTHFLLSHPLRKPIVSSIGERPFRAIYSIVALVTLGGMIWVYASIGEQQPLWIPGDSALLLATVLMWLGAILFIGSFVGNPALPGAPGPKGPPKGVLAITRHPMMWGFAIWAIVHIIVVATPKGLVFDGSILFLALAGAAMQDRKKRLLMGRDWHEWSAQTAFWPFTRGFAYPGIFALAGGTLLFLLATWLHPMPVGPWAFAV
jgi:uncharacterized membrane protein